MVFTEFIVSKKNYDVRKGLQEVVFWFAKSRGHLGYFVAVLWASFG